MSQPRTSPLLALLPAATLLFYLFLSEPPSVLLLFFSALLLHEGGHLGALLLLGTGTPLLTVAGVGLRMTPARPLLPREEAFTLLAGPLFNVAVALAVLRLSRSAFFFTFSAVHLLFGFGNLLPFGGSDGERLLRLLLYRVMPRHAHRLLAFLSRATAAVFFFTLLFLYYLTGNGLSGVVFSLYFLLTPTHTVA